MNRPDVNAPAWIDLSLYDQSDFNRGRSGVVILLWWLVQAVLFPLTLHNWSGLRCQLLRLFGAKIGQQVVLRPTARITYPWKVVIGDYSWIGDDVVLYSLDQITIGSHTVISQDCYLCTGSHNWGDRSFALKTAPIVVGNGVWLATDCFVAAGVMIGSNTVVGGRSTVWHDLPAGMLAWGNPCRAKRDRHQENQNQEKP